MPRDLSGNYTLPEGNPVAGGTVIDVEWANPTMADIAQQLNNVFTRDGLLGPLAPWKLTDGTVAAPSMTFNSELGMGLYRQEQNIMGLAINGVAVVKWTTNGLEVVKDLLVDGKAHIDGELTVDGSAAIAGSLQVKGALVDVDAVPFAHVPVGTILDFAGPDVTVPAGYLVCRGQAISRVTYAKLFLAIGGYWGAGDGVNTFNVPDLQRYGTIGMGGTSGVSDGPANTLAAKGGVETNILQIAHMPSHAHGNNAWQDGHNHGIVTGAHNHGINDPGHVHRHQAASHNAIAFGRNEAYGLYGGGTMDDGAFIHNTEASGIGIWLNDAGNLGGYTDVRTPGVGVTIHAAGSNQPFTNYHPVACVNKIIKF